MRYFLSLIKIIIYFYESKSYKELCDSKLYCDGPILKLVNNLKVFKDSKTFVDMPTSIPYTEAVEGIEKMMNRGNVTRSQLRAFINKNFGKVGSEVGLADLSDFNAAPLFLQNLKDLKLRSFALKIVEVWPSLFRVLDPSSICDGCATSALPAKYPFIVPGGRFSEFYYFDTFFEIEGLLISEMSETVKNMIKDFLKFVETYGFIPNGSRIYYLNRSQPPFLAQMMEVYLDKSNDNEFMINNLKTLDKEYEYWISKHSVKVPCARGIKSCYLTRFFSDSNSPRPESYSEDIKVYNNAKNLTSKQRSQLYTNLIAGAESGWDYSSRWTSLKVNSTIKDSYKALTTINTINIVPVDLNSYMYKNEITLQNFHKIAMKHVKGDTKSYKYHDEESKKYERNAYNRAQLMENLLWDSKNYQFSDYDLSNKILNKEFSTASFTPFWSDALTPKFRRNIKNYILSFNSIEKLLDENYYGIPTTKISSGLQWDYPNMWPPTIYLTVKAIMNANNTAQRLLSTQNGISHEDSVNVKKLRRLAIRLANSYIRTVYCSWYKSGGKLPNVHEKFKNASTTDPGYFYEKYSVESLGVAGGGGEYAIQTGFGWTNGVAIYLIKEFNNDIKLPSFDQCAKNSNYLN